MSTDNKTSETVITVLNTTKPITLGYLNSENIISAKNSNNDIDMTIKKIKEKKGSDRKNKGKEL